MKQLYANIKEKKALGHKMFALLVDPGKMTDEYVMSIAKVAKDSFVDFFLVGGSLTSEYVDITIDILRSNSTLPIVLYPGSLLQLSDKADAMFLLSLISGRNADLLIGNHVLAAPLLKKSKMEIISTGYILIESESSTSVEYISNTRPIPANKPDIAAATAMAGELLGMKMIYLEAGSGANKKVNTEMIQYVSKYISIPLIVGGGICTEDDIEMAYNAGADIVVVGTAVENDIHILAQLSLSIKKFKK